MKSRTNVRNIERHVRSKQSPQTQTNQIQSKTLSFRCKFSQRVEHGRKLTHLASRAIDMLPRTLAMIGESLMSQTGWNVSILMGGPTPDSDGVIMTYL